MAESAARRPFLDVFLSHASEDRLDVASPLANALVTLGYKVWISDHDVVLGDSLPLKINDGLRSCQFGVVVISPHYLAKHWTMKELAALTSREETEGRDVIIPVLYNIDRVRLTQELPLWAPAVSDSWDGNVARTAALVAKALGPPISSPNAVHAFDLAKSLSSGELDIGPRHAALMVSVGHTVNAVGDVWSKVQAWNRNTPKGLSEVRKRANAALLARGLSVPAGALHDRAGRLEAAASEYLSTLRRLVDAAAFVRGLDRDSLIGLNEVYCGVVASTFIEVVAAFTDKRAQTVTFPKRHPDLTRVFDKIGNDLGRIAFAFETLVDFCLSEMPLKVRVILER